MARPPVPTAVKFLRGTARRDRTNLREPQPALGAPPPRRALALAVKRRYRALVRSLRGLRVLGTTDGPVLELTAAALAEHDQYGEIIAREGAVYSTTTTQGSVMYRARPELALASDAWRRAFNGLVQLGLTPAARTKVDMLPIPSISKWEALVTKDPIEALRWRRARQAVPPDA